MLFSSTVDQSWPVKNVSLCYSTDGAYFLKREPMPKVLDCFKEKFQCALDLSDVDDNQMAFYVEVDYEDGPYLMSAPGFGLRFKQKMRVGRPPGPSPEFVAEDIEYPSTIDDLPNLKAKVAYDKLRKNMPIVVLLAGGTPGSTKPLHGEVERMSRKGVFAILPTLRGRDGSPGKADIMGREVYDIVDAVDYVKANYAELVNPNLVSIVGYSSGGSLALLAGARFPGYFRTLVSFFPITDRADQPYWELYDREPATDLEGKALRIAKMVEKFVGGTPKTAPDAYIARRTLSAVANASQTSIHLLHDLEDGLVPYEHSQRYSDAAKAAGLTNVRFHLSYPDDGRRWQHGHPDKKPDLIAGEHKFVGQLTGGKPDRPTLPNEGELIIPGYLRTEHFEIWLGDGLDATAALKYSLTDTCATFSVAPHSGNADAPVRVMLDATKYSGWQAEADGQCMTPTTERGSLVYELRHGEQLELSAAS